MTPEEFRDASRGLAKLLSESADISSCATFDEFAEALAEVPSDPPPPRSCDCEVSDAWRCAKQRHLVGQIACRCKCHRYLET
jgi:hypothetical protein